MVHDAEHAAQCIKLVPIFQTLSDAERAEIAPLVQQRHFAAGTSLFAAGDAVESLMIVAGGQVKITQIAANGKEQLLYLLNPGDFDGEAALFTTSTRQNFGTALAATDICMIRRQDFQQQLQTSPQLALNILNTFGQRLANVAEQSTQATTASIEERLANYLLETAGEKLDDFKLPLKKKDIASYLGTTPETISRKFREFTDDGLIEKLSVNHFRILDADRLAMVE
ncbi:Crp/Fnr family transcriptional regulator [Loigolactobacillus zhaoyuanensis]|uniref:Crp/Fnr family transcriptional regulator n=1 Tax=Loigolactobacillus zhaoyuanensis TaxID=2486017 RepID=A0ABW8UJV2_9LACO|nr:Crp/Fnr family transcriptional regulator [Loigolactobacillus zhaoyuanensis]